MQQTALVEPSESLKERRNREEWHSIERLEDVLCEIEAQCRKPDNWESYYLHCGMSSAYLGQYDFAATQAWLALRPPQERSPGLQFSNLYECDLSLLKRRMIELRAQLYAHF